MSIGESQHGEEIERITMVLERGRTSLVPPPICLIGALTGVAHSSLDGTLILYISIKSGKYYKFLLSWSQVVSSISTPIMGPYRLLPVPLVRRGTWLVRVPYQFKGSPSVPLIWTWATSSPISPHQTLNLIFHIE